MKRLRDLLLLALAMGALILCSSEWFVTKLLGG